MRAFKKFKDVCDKQKMSVGELLSLTQTPHPNSDKIQRDYSKEWNEERKRQYIDSVIDEIAFQPILIVDNGDDKPAFVIDGQHRIMALREELDRLRKTDIVEYRKLKYGATLLVFRINAWQNPKEFTPTISEAAKMFKEFNTVGVKQTAEHMAHIDNLINSGK